MDCVECVELEWGVAIWNQMAKKIGIGGVGFSIHKVYDENLMAIIAESVACEVDCPESEIMFKFGAHFMTFVTRYGYDQITSVLGRKLCDFINGLDNLHDYISNLYKVIKPPSFYVEKEDDEGLVFHYNTSRKYVGYVHYVRGLIHSAAVMYYELQDVKVETLKQEVLGEVMHSVLRVTYKNCTVRKQDPWLPALSKLRSITPVSVNSDIVFDSFPFSIIFDETMQVVTCGVGVVKTFPTLIGKKITDFFVLTKPIGVDLTWNFMKNRPVNVLVELTSTVALWAEYEEYLRSQEILDTEHPPLPPKQRDDSASLKLRGTTDYLGSWNAVIFMCTPIFDNMDVMMDVGLYISDLSFQDSLQMLLMTGPQQSAELKLALDMEQAKTSKLADTLAKLEKENQKADSIVFSMIPREIAVRLKKGESAVSIAEVFENVTVLFSDVVGFTNICTRITPMEVIAILNKIYTVFDTLSERYGVFKVETIGDVYMAVSGAPMRTPLHAQRICDMALEMQTGISHVKNPVGGGCIPIRIGIHSGGVVAGVVGRKMIRYCLFGDTVNTASRLESTGKGREIHVSKSVYDLVYRTDDYIFDSRGVVYIKGKGQMRTFWLKAKKGKFISIPGSSLLDQRSINSKAHSKTIEGTGLIEKANYQPDVKKHDDSLSFSKAVEKIVYRQTNDMKNYQEENYPKAEEAMRQLKVDECKKGPTINNAHKNLTSNVTEVGEDVAKEKDRAEKVPQPTSNCRNSTETASHTTPPVETGNPCQSEVSSVHQLLPS
ncbi:soluble guanylate cyclase 88E [Ciona intestinalis]